MAEPQRLGETSEFTEEFERLKTWFDDKARAWEALSPEGKREAEAREMEESAARIRAERLRKVELEIPRKYREFEVLIPEVKLWTRALLDGQEVPSLLITGTNRVGKTGTMYAVKRDLILSGFQGRVLFEDWVLLLRRMMPRNDDGDAVRFEELLQAGVLALDDVGVEKESDWKLEQLFAVVNHRLKWDRPTIFITNIPASELVLYFGKRIGTRILEMAKVVPITRPVWEASTTQSPDGGLRGST